MAGREACAGVDDADIIERSIADAALLARETGVGTDRSTRSCGSELRLR